MAIKLSHSRVELYKQCPRKYQFQYIDKYKVNTTKSALLFGKSMDKAINYLLKQHKNSKTINLKYAQKVFLKEMSTWNGQNELIFFKSEIPPEDFIKGDLVGNQLRSFNYLNKIGVMMIDTYIKDILPQFKSVIEIQKKKVIKNEHGDQFTMLLDCIVELHDSRIVLMDNKTASKPYPANSVAESTQLATYNEFYPTPYCGYVVMHKKLTNNQITWQFIVDELKVNLKDEVFEVIDNTLQNIKAGNFPPNYKSCYAFGKQCEYYKACKHGNYKGLTKDK